MYRIKSLDRYCVSYQNNMKNISVFRASLAGGGNKVKQKKRRNESK